MAAAPPQVAPDIDSDEDLQRLYNWVDEIALSRPKRNISRDFADGVLFAEIVNHHFPRLVEMHNYSAANSQSQKSYNWNTLNNKVLKKIGYTIHPQDIEDVSRAAPGAIERVLKVLQDKVIQVQEGQLRYRAPVANVVPRVATSREGDEPPLAKISGRGASPTAASGRAKAERFQSEVDAELLVEKEQKINELHEVVDIMSEKIKKLEQLVRIKDAKIEAMSQKLQKYGLA
eukprot:CAMPEP_0206495338 /NCGR_PEP_ID=MMETSP0324_2-20121206/48437_1 /ASSEMBLY_ACC=CAM_ASM_000836 /TAXON_ID=2866 /ORGANISM="Crypthecodinium cohnii, Strain Seligo" /LENGTH=230 /DNA_ID=CAMNT_0053979511 /DNA_START=18 /DNA_END=710 /DNA_ORIENTATION=-